MPRSDSIAGSWPQLAERLACADTLARWVGREPVLAAAGAVTDLPGLTRVGGDPLHADQLIGALVRLAAVDGGDDADAVLVLLHLLGAGARSLARRLGDLIADIDTLVAGELTIQIRSFPWRRRTRAYAANLLLDTRAALWRELRPNRARRGPVDAPLLIDPTATDDPAGARLLDRPIPGPGEDALDLMDVLLWAERAGVVDAADVALLVELEYAREFGGRAPRERVAAAHGINERTVRRRRDRALAALRAAAPAYLAA